MSDSDDDVLGMLPMGGGRTTGSMLPPSRRQRPPVTFSDTDSDDSPVKPPTGGGRPGGRPGGLGLPAAGSAGSRTASPALGVPVKKKPGLPAIGGRQDTKAPSSQARSPAAPGLPSDSDDDGSGDTTSMAFEEMDDGASVQSKTTPAATPASTPARQPPVEVEEPKVAQQEAPKEDEGGFSAQQARLKQMMADAGIDDDDTGSSISLNDTDEETPGRRRKSGGGVADKVKAFEGAAGSGDAAPARKPTAVPEAAGVAVTEVAQKFEREEKERLAREAEQQRRDQERREAEEKEKEKEREAKRKVAEEKERQRQIAAKAAEEEAAAKARAEAEAQRVEAERAKEEQERHRQQLEEQQAAMRQQQAAATPPQAAVVHQDPVLAERRANILAAEEPMSSVLPPHSPQPHQQAPSIASPMATPPTQQAPIGQASNESGFSYSGTGYPGLPPTAPASSSSPATAAAVGPETTSDAVLRRVQERLQAREQAQRNKALAQHVAAAGGAGPGRAGTPTRSVGALSAGGGRTTVDASRDRMLKENLRLTDEVAFLQKEMARLREQSELGQTNETERATLRLERDLLRRRADDAEDTLQRQEKHFEAAKAQLSEHLGRVESELETSNQAIAQFEGIMGDKDRQLAQAAAAEDALRSEVAEARHELMRTRRDADASREEASARLDRANALLDDAKRQRQHLLELNDKFSKDRDSAEAEKRKALEELRVSKREHTAEVERLEHDVGQAKNEAARALQQKQGAEESYRTEIADAKRGQERLEHQVKRLQDELDELSNAQSSAERAAVQAAQSESEGLRHDLAQTKRALDDAERSLAQTKAERDGAVRDRDGQRAAWAAQSRAEKDAATAKLQRELNALEQHLTSALQAKDAAEERAQEAQQTMLDGEQRVAHAEAKCGGLATAMEEMLASDDRLVTENEALRMELTQLGAECDALRDALEEKDENGRHVDELTEENERLGAECTRLTAERSNLQREAQRQQQEMQRWREEVDGLLHGQTAAPSAAVAGGYSSAVFDRDRGVGDGTRDRSVSSVPRVFSAVGGIAGVRSPSRGPAANHMARAPSPRYRPPAATDFTY